MIQTLIVDDEPLARRKINTFLEEESDFAVMGECGNGLEAVEAIISQSPDLVFLDIQMPELDGLGVVQTVGADRMPLTVFVTAFDQYAIQAFEAQALDYLLKPFTQERFIQTLQRIKNLTSRKESSPIQPQLENLLQELRGKRYLERIVVKSASRIYFLRTEEIEWIEAAGNYAEIHIEQDTHLIRETMSRLEEQLDPARFMRIHRSYLVNLDQVKEIQPYFNGDSVVILHSGKDLPMSRTFRDKFNQRMGI